MKEKKEKLIVLSGLRFHHAIVIPYRNIRELRKCTQSLFPMGIKITYEDTKKNTLVTEKISMMKRNKWMDGFYGEESWDLISAGALYLWGLYICGDFILS